ncbi:MAG: DUF6785 family protein [Candidatus Latescibacterota bacterium]|nr:DUF6785 family protein [Candidatus Latescibacterota bacterium]
MLGWMPFVIALYLVMIALMVILRRQWMNNERLLYPLMQAPLAMVQQDRKRRRPQLYRIPFESFANHAPRLHPADGDVWRLNLYRTGGSVNVQHIAWSNTRVEKPQFHMPQRCGVVHFTAQAVQPAERLTQPETSAISCPNMAFCQLAGSPTVKAVRQ